MADHWIQKATDKMKEKGTIGSFGKATPAKIAKAKKEGGKEEKKAVFAENVSKFAHKKKKGHKRSALKK
jgi:hypothetical protein